MAPSLTKVALWTFAILLGLMIVSGVVMQVFFAWTAPVNAFISLLQPHLSSLRGVPWQDLLFLVVLFISGIAIPTLYLVVTAGRRGLLTLLPVDVILFFISIYVWVKLSELSFGRDFSIVIGLPLCGLFAGLVQCFTHYKLRLRVWYLAPLVSFVCCIVVFIFLRRVIPPVLLKGFP